MSSQRVFSVEFSPPRNPEGVEKLRAARAELERVGPAFYSVTFGAGGSTREGTISTTLEIHRAGRQQTACQAIEITQTRSKL
jgi:methylenetetrahydrofolate reductase (NADPH)